MEALFFIPLLGFFSNAVLGIYVIITDPRSRTNRLYFLLSLSIAAWTLGYFLSVASSSPAQAFLWDKVSTVGLSTAALMVPFIFLDITKSRFLRDWKLPAAMSIPSLLFSLAAILTPLLTSGVSMDSYGYVQVPGGFYPLFLMYLFFYASTGCLVGAKHMKESKSRTERYSMLLLILAVVIPAAGGILSEIVLTKNNFPWPAATSLTTVSSFLVALTILKFRLMNPFSMSLQRKVTSAFVVLVIIVVLIFEITGYSVSMEVSISEARDSMLSSLEYKGYLIGQFLDDLEGDMDIISKAPSVRSMLTGAAGGACDGEPRNLPEMTEDAEVFLLDFLGSRGYEGMMLTDRCGRVWWSSKGSGAGFDLSDAPEGFGPAGEAFSEAAATGSFSVSDVKLNGGDAPPSFFVGYPIRDGDSIICVMLLEVGMSRITPMLEDAGASGKSTETYLVGADHYLRSGLPGTGNAGILVTKSGSACVSRCFSAEGRAGGYLADDMYQERDQEGAESFCSYAYVPRMDYCMISLMGMEDVQSYMDPLASTMPLFSAGILALSLVMSFLIARSISKPIHRLRDVAIAIGEGDYDRKTGFRSRDEIGQLANAIEQMSGQLKASHDELEKHAEVLEKEVGERTKEMNDKVEELTKTKTAILNMMEDMDEANTKLVKTQEELKRSLSELKEVDQKKNEFISIAAHELKTPLTSIHGFAQLLIKAGGSFSAEKKAKYLKIVESETKRLAGLVNDILDLSRIDLGTIKMSYDKLDLHEFMSGMKKEMTIPIKEKGLKAKFSMGKNLPLITADREKLTQILINIINNAIKYTPKGSIIVGLEKEGGSVHFSVKDTGIGIKKENLERIFERFYQVDSSYTRAAGGTGLGLAITKEFIKLMGGRIWVESRPDMGSEFHFTLPVNGPSSGGDVSKETPIEAGERDRDADEGKA
jgi:signal transduction histidine kinase